LAPETADAIRTGPKTGAIFAVEGTDFEYAGVTSDSTISVFVEKDLVDIEKDRLKATFPTLGQSQ
jgi:hypothetical protein